MSIYHRIRARVRVAAALGMASALVAGAVLPATAFGHLPRTPSAYPEGAPRARASVLVARAARFLSARRYYAYSGAETSYGQNIDRAGRVVWWRDVLTVEREPGKLRRQTRITGVDPAWAGQPIHGDVMLWVGRTQYIRDPLRRRWEAIRVPVAPTSTEGLPLPGGTTPDAWRGDRGTAFVLRAIHHGVATLSYGQQSAAGTLSVVASTGQPISFTVTTGGVAQSVTGSYAFRYSGASAPFIVPTTP